MAEKKKLEEMTDHELLLEQVKAQKRSSYHQLLGSVANCLLIVVLVVVLGVLVPKTLHTFNELETALDNIETLTTEAKDSLDGLDEMITNVNDVVENNTKGIDEAIQNFNNVDFEGLNQAIKDLADVVQPLAGLTNGLGGLFG